MRPPGTAAHSTYQTFKSALSSGDKALPYVLHRWIGYPFFVSALQLGLKANHLTVLSLLLGIGGAALFLLDGYAWKVSGVILVNLGLGVDTVDGALARHRGEASEFGAWLSAFGVTLRTIVIWSCVAGGVYWREGEPLALILGIVVLGHLFMSYHLMRTNKTYAFYRYTDGAVGISKTSRLGLEAGQVLFLTVFGLLNQLYLLLIVFAGVGAIPWVILLVRAWQSHVASQSE